MRRAMVGARAEAVVSPAPSWSEAAVSHARSRRLGCQPSQGGRDRHVDGSLQPTSLSRW